MSAYRSALEAALEAMRKASTWIYYRRLAGGDPMSEEEELLFRAVAKCEEALRRTDQEPVAWRLRIGESDVFGYCDKESDADFFGKQSGRPYVKEPLYASPPEPENPAARRLTDEEFDELVIDEKCLPRSPLEFGRVIESSLAALLGVKLP